MTRPFKPSSQILIKGKAYPYLNDDSPMIAYQRSGPAFVAQPLPHSSEQYGIIPVPLMMTDEWERIWFLDQPDHMTPYRTHGGII